MMTIIKDGLKAAAWCNDPWPAPFGSKAQVIESIEDFLRMASLAGDGGNGSIGARDASRAIMQERLVPAATCLQALAGGDVAKMEQTGYELSRGAHPRRRRCKTRELL